jgi:hypothetical protein
MSIILNQSPQQFQFGGGQIFFFVFCVDVQQQENLQGSGRSGEGLGGWVLRCGSKMALARFF